jgi:outer membrane usher protein
VFTTGKPFNTRELTATPRATSSRGFVINYDAFAQTDTDAQLAIWSEERYFDPTGVFSNTGIAYLYRNQHRYTRYDTSWSISNPDTLNTTQIGDTISTSLAWSRSIRISGFQWRSNFALRPDLVTFPVPALGGSAVVPSPSIAAIAKAHRALRKDRHGPHRFPDISLSRD